MDLVARQRWRGDYVSFLYGSKYFKPILLVTSGGLIFYFVSRFFRKKKTNYLDCEKWPTSGVQLKKRRTISEDVVTESYNWSELQKNTETSGNQNSTTTLVDGTPITPYQLGQMGLEALDTVVSYWEEALSSCSELRKSEEFISSLGELLDNANKLQW
eukprot:TRINITY_DN26854_c0_g1_i1.p1 TRINITY_DN26854_c0_g1~~TRINITY_DN26854_c0_g1_i1.p1  ORF type:complete len:158 (-),score=20.18 TRINITY_DN26854_c0_g1_i1:84-557(-)